MSRHPRQLAATDDGGEVIANDVRNLGRHSGKWPVVVSGAGVACEGGGKQGVAIGASGKHEGALGKLSEHGPSFGRSSAVAPGGWPAEAVGQEVARTADGSNPEA